MYCEMYLLLGRSWFEKQWPPPSVCSTEFVSELLESVDEGADLYATLDRMKEHGTWKNLYFFEANILFCISYLRSFMQFSLRVRNSVADPDQQFPHGSVSYWKVGSGSASVCRWQDKIFGIWAYLSTFSRGLSLYLEASKYIKGTVGFGSGSASKCKQDPGDTQHWSEIPNFNPSLQDTVQRYDTFSYRLRLTHMKDQPRKCRH